MTIQHLPQNSGELAPAGLTLQDQARLRRALESSTSLNTRRAYNQAWRRWTAWSKARGIPALPASPELVAAFLLESLRLDVMVLLVIPEPRFCPASLCSASLPDR